MISILFTEIGLPAYAIDQLFKDIRCYNLEHPRKPPVSNVDLSAEIDTITLSQMPLIGRALAKVWRKEFLDEGGLFPLTVDENALLFAMSILEAYYKKSRA